jgi:uncharacterized protein YjbJ (UPF0337 family)
MTTPGTLIMDDDTIIGAAKQATGRIERAAGKLAGDPNTEIRGAARELGGAAQRAYGEAKDEVRSAFGGFALRPVLAGVVFGLILGLFLNRR